MELARAHIYSMDYTVAYERYTSHAATRCIIHYLCHVTSFNNWQCVRLPTKQSAMPSWLILPTDWSRDVYSGCVNIYDVEEKLLPELVFRFVLYVLYNIKNEVV